MHVVTIELKHASLFQAKEAPFDVGRDPRPI